MDRRFQVNLRGIIDILSNHLYSRPEVFVRELLQNAVDAITARQELEPGHVGEIQLTVTASKGKPPTLEVADNGVGLTEDEIHRFLATIGETSKRDAEGKGRPDFLGQFGIGLLSCFVVSDEIVAITRSAKGGPAMEWRGRADGSYNVRTLEGDFAFGTRVYLTAKPGQSETFTVETIRHLASLYGGLLPYPVRVASGKSNVAINERGAPWRRTYAGPKERQQALLRYGKEVFDETYLDAIPLESSAGGVEGVAFVLPRAANLAERPGHRVYLKNMLLSEKADNLLPSWAFFARAVVNVNGLRPTASREGFYEDERLEAARAELGDCLRRHLARLAERESARFERFLAVHHLALKALAAEDDECYGQFIDWLPFETTQGPQTVRAMRERGEAIRYVADAGQFHQVAKVAAAQGGLLVNAGYVHEADLLARLPQFDDTITVERVDPGDIAQGFDELTEAEQDEADAVIDTIAAALKPFRCRVDARKFAPADLPALYSLAADARFRRSLEQAREHADPLFAGVLASLNSGRTESADALLVLNFTNGLVRRLMSVRDREVIRRVGEALYVQALLMAQQPLSGPELGLLGKSLGGLVECVVKAQGGGR